MRKRNLVLAMATALSGCAANVAQLSHRASFDLDCDAANLSIREIDAGTRLVSGCGKRAIYVENFNNARHTAWLLNSPIEPVKVSAR